MSRFSKYSLANQMLIFGQRPDATHVLGYRAWNNAGYQVRKGEKGIAIYAPMRFTREDPARRFRHDSSRTAAPASAWPGSSTSVRSTRSPARHRPPPRPRRRHRPTRGTTDAHRAPRSSSRPSSSATTSSSSTRRCPRPARLHRRSPHHLRSRPGPARRIRHPRARDGARAAALPRRSHHPPRPHHARDRSRSRHVPALRAARDRWHRRLGRLHPAPTAARPTRWTRASSASAPPRNACQPSSTRFAST